MTTHGEDHTRFQECVWKKPVGLHRDETLSIGHYVQSLSNGHDTILMDQNRSCSVVHFHQSAWFQTTHSHTPMIGLIKETTTADGGNFRARFQTTSAGVKLLDNIQILYSGIDATWSDRQNSESLNFWHRRINSNALRNTKQICKKNF